MNKKYKLESNQGINFISIIAILVASAFVATFNETILNVALSAIMKDMNVSAGTVQWLVTAYMTVAAVMVPVTAFLIQSFKTRKLFLSAMGLLLIGTICAAFSNSFAMLLISRMIQSSGTGMIIPIMMNTILLVAPKEKLGISMAICVPAILLGPAFGPTVSGIILQYFSWHALFIMLIPIVAILMIIGTLFLVNVGELTKPKMDYLSIILSTIGVGTIIYAISSISEGNIRITLISFIIGIICLILFIKRQNALKEPMLNLSPFKYPKFVMGTILVMIAMMVTFTMSIMLPMYMEGSLGKTSSVAGLALLPAVICAGLAAPVGGKIYDKFGVKFLIPLGTGIVTVFVFSISLSKSDTSLVHLVIIYICMSVGIGLFMSPSQTHGLNQLPKEYYPHGVAIVNTLQQVSAAIGSSLFIGIMSAAQINALEVHHATNEVAIATGFSTATLVVCGFAFVGLILSFFFGRNISQAKDKEQVRCTTR
ncbi:MULTISPECIES: MDR family MFS transporter [Clostridium]|uniref:MDR family MFS transporter n=1 Tax=Clostridium TaxID=1485 RepID=UPI0003D37209|nr:MULTISPECIES: MDR family MFS transporter [Clostridium]ALB46552.1 DHA2 family efflux MFS transporter permease subunit [Clostridium beijerinckii NRRL B-598]